MIQSRHFFHSFIGWEKWSGATPKDVYFSASQALGTLIGQLWPQREMQIAKQVSQLGLTTDYIHHLHLPFRPKLSNQHPQHLGILRNKQLLKLHQTSTLFPHQIYRKQPGHTTLWMTKHSYQLQDRTKSIPLKRLCATQ